MKIKRKLNLQNSTPNLECGIRTAAHSSGVQCSMPARGTSLVGCSQERNLAGLDVQSLKLNVECFGSSRPQPSQRGIALIITLILLSVVTFMAIAFLALSRRERGAVSTVTDAASARYAADAALASAEAQVMANVLSTTNPYNFSLLVSTNYINAAGFQSGVSSFTNVNYDHLYNS